ncbi:MAG: PIG-L family deacetylase [Leptolyngbyaceae cyanobacterium bins.349]|nr:PIG-L family deacetylase [Leptolyngbyaceae cyanobacterium bins.349]
MSHPTLLNKILDYWNRRLFRRRLYQQGQLIEASQQPAVIFAPHQDDETFGCGGVIALKRRQGIPVKVVYLTDGRNCYFGCPMPVPIAAEECIQMRQQEALKALHTLGVEAADVVFLNYEDSKLGDLQGKQRQTAIAELQNLLHQFAPQEVYVPYYNDMHSDHIETFYLVKDAIARWNASVDVWQYLIWSLWRYEHLDELVANQFANLYKVAIAPVQQQKQDAIQAYRSQLLPIVGNFRALPKTFLSFFNSAPYELFVKIAPDYRSSIMTNSR